jgi:hypothetical protein
MGRNLEACVGSKLKVESRPRQSDSEAQKQLTLLSSVLGASAVLKVAAAGTWGHAESCTIAPSRLESSALATHGRESEDWGGDF